jgi:myosin heavy subunit
MRAELDRLKGENGELMEHLDCAESDLTSATARLATADSELTQLRQLIDGAPRELEMAREQYKQQLEECERRIQHSEATKQELDGQVSNTNARLDKTLAEVAHLQHVLADREETIRQLQIKQDTMQSDMNILIGNNDLNERLLRGDQDPNNGSVDLMELCQRNVVANNIRIRLLQQQNTEIREQMLMASVERASSDGGCFKLASTRPIQLAKPPMNMRRILAASNTVLQAYELHHQTVLGVGPNFDQVEQISAEQTPVWHPHLQNFTPISGSRPQTARIVDMEVQPVELKQVEVCWPNVDSAYT